jgi:hypothetical protein
VNDESNGLNETQFPGNIACYNQIKEVIGERSAIAFVGAGVSAPLYPTWGAFLKELIDQAINEGMIVANDVRDVRQQVEIDPLEAATYLEELFTHDRFRARLSTVFESKGTTTECHSLLVRLRPKAIVTLNYDNGLEAAFSNVNSALPISIRAQDQSDLVKWQQGQLFGAGKLPILHWHGIPSDPAGMVFTGDDYNRY